jgi:hypothetical protein
MDLKIGEEWIRARAALEEGCSVSAGSEVAFNRSLEINLTRQDAMERKKSFAVFFQDGEFGRMLWRDWLKVVKHGIAEEGKYRLVARVTPGGQVQLEPTPPIV